MTPAQSSKTSLDYLKSSEFDVCVHLRDIRFSPGRWQYTANIPHGFVLDRAGANWLLRAVRGLYFHDQLTVTL